MTVRFAGSTIAFRRRWRLPANEEARAEHLTHKSVRSTHARGWGGHSYAAERPIGIDTSNGIAATRKFDDRPPLPIATVCARTQRFVQRIVAPAVR